MDDDYRENWMNFEDFEDYIDDIVDHEINGSALPNVHQWDTNEIKDDADVDNFYKELCGNLATAGG